MFTRKIVEKSFKFKFQRWFTNESERPIILGIESSCDDTGAAIINRHGKVLGENLHSQLKTHLM